MSRTLCSAVLLILSLLLPVRTALAVDAAKFAPQAVDPHLFVSSVFFVEETGNGDAFMDPGETYDVTLELGNDGTAPATGVTATLSFPSPQIVFANNTTPYSDIPVGESKLNINFISFTIATDALCGGLFQMDIEAHATSGPSLNDTAVVHLGGYSVGDNVVLTSTTVPVPIPDFQEGIAQATVTYPDSLDTVSSVAVQLSATHTFDGDLTFTLISPAGTSVTLIDRKGGSGDNFTDTLLFDGASAPITSGLAPFTGDYDPETPLSVLANENASGVWTLKVIDNAGGDTGTLTKFILTITPNVPACTIYAKPTAPELAPILHTKLKTPATVPVAGPILYSYEWSSNSGADDTAVHGPAAVEEDSLPEGPGISFDVGETWTVQVTPYFNGTPGDPATAKFIITSDGVVFGGWVMN